MKSLHPTIFLSLLCTAKCPRYLFNKLEGWASTQKMAVSPNSLRFGLLLAREPNVCFTLYINDIFIHHTGYNYNLHYTPCPRDTVLADWPFVRQWIESLCGIVSVGLDSAVAELSSPQVNRVSQHWIQNCILRNWIEFRSIELKIVFCAIEVQYWIESSSCRATNCHQHIVIMLSVHVMFVVPIFPRWGIVCYKAMQK